MLQIQYREEFLMKKRVISLLLILVLCVSLCACGTGSTNPTTEATAAPTLDGTPTTESTENKEITVEVSVFRTQIQWTAYS